MLELNSKRKMISHFIDVNLQRELVVEIDDVVEEITRIESNRQPLPYESPSSILNQQPESKILLSKQTETNFDSENKDLGIASL